MKIQENILLAQYTTFKIGGPARFFCCVQNEDELVEAVKQSKQKGLNIFVLGGGSNILVSDAGFSGMIIKMEILGKRYFEDVSSEEGALNGQAIVSVGAGETWDDLVAETVSKEFYGLENLSAIPGTVGAAPVQNIGAYGAEASQVIHGVRALNTESMQFVELSNKECQFDYRDSVFKRTKGKYIITRVDLKLSRNGEVNIAYKDLKEYFEKKLGSANKKPALKDVREAVIGIRLNKLPDWKKWGTAGSYFKNPIIAADQFAELKKKYPELPGYPDRDGRIKVSLAWILDKVCKAKDFLSGNKGARTYEKQALVVVATPGATAEDVIALTHDLMKRVKEMTGISIEAEVEWVN
jgi:UDP-N-acetylmuramate dehydrogenase